MNPRCVVLLALVRWTSGKSSFPGTWQVVSEAAKGDKERKVTLGGIVLFGRGEEMPRSARREWVGRK